MVLSEFLGETTSITIRVEEIHNPYNHFKDLGIFAFRINYFTYFFNSCFSPLLVWVLKQQQCGNIRGSEADRSEPYLC